MLLTLLQEQCTVEAIVIGYHMNIYDYLTCGVSNINAVTLLIMNQKLNWKKWFTCFKERSNVCKVQVEILNLCNIPIIYNENFKKVWNLWNGQ